MMMEEKLAKASESDLSGGTGMFGSDLYIALILGVTLSLIFTEKQVFYLRLVVPGYLALVFNQPILC